MIVKNLTNNQRAFIKLINEIDKRNILILRERFLKHKSLKEVAEKFNLSNQGVKEIEDRVLKRVELEFDYVNLK
jgi:DNA-directed RNA polymerase specialized sigma subunit